MQSKIIKKKKLQDKIYNYYSMCVLVLSGKNPLPFLPDDIIKNLIKLIIDTKKYKHLIFSKIKTKAIINYYKDYQEYKSLISPLLKENEICTDIILKRKNCLKIFDICINYVHIIRDEHAIKFRKKFIPVLKEKIIELFEIVNCELHDIDKNNECYELDKLLYIKLQECYYHFFNDKLPMKCIICKSSQSTLAYNYNLCHIHLSQKFK